MFFAITTTWPFGVMGLYPTTLHDRFSGLVCSGKDCIDGSENLNKKLRIAELVGLSVLSFKDVSLVGTDLVN